MSSILTEEEVEGGCTNFFVPGLDHSPTAVSQNGCHTFECFSAVPLNVFPAWFLQSLRLSFGMFVFTCLPVKPYSVTVPVLCLYVPLSVRQHPGLCLSVCVYLFLSTIHNVRLDLKNAVQGMLDVTPSSSKNLYAFIYAELATSPRRVHKRCTLDTASCVVHHLQMVTIRHSLPEEVKRLDEIETSVSCQCTSLSGFTQLLAPPNF